MVPFRWRYSLPFLVLWLAFALRLFHLDFQSIWWDEGHSIFVAAHPLSQIPTLPAMDVHPPAYFALLHLWMNIAGHSEFALRYLSVLFSLLTIALLWRFAASMSRRFLLPRPSTPLLPNSPACPERSRRAPLLASLLAALSPMYVAYAQEVRSYTMITFLALASTFTLWRLLFAGRQCDTAQTRGGLLLLYVVSTAACLYTHYFTLFLLIFQNLAWLVWLLRSKFVLKHTASTLSIHTGLWLASQMGILLLFTPQLLLALRQITSYTNPNLIPPTLPYFISRTWQAYTTGLTVDPTLARWGTWSIASVLLISWLLQTITTKQKSSPHNFSSPSSNFSSLFSNLFFLISWLTIPLAAYFLVLQRQPSFEPRYLILITPALFLLLAFGLSGVSRVKYQVSSITHHVSRITFYVSRFTFYALSLIPLLIFTLSLHSYYTNETYFKDDSAGVAEWLAAETTPNDIVYVDVPHPFHYYAAKGQIPAPTRYLFVDIHTAADTLTREAVGRDRLYWITWYGSDTDPRDVIPFLAEKFGHQLGQRDFRGYHVEWFSLPQSDATFSLPTTLTPIKATFGDVLRLDGIAYGDTTTVDNPTWATLHFTLLRKTDVDYKVSLRLRGEDGRVISQVDRDLLNDRHFRTSAWPIADPALNQALNVYTLPLASDTSPGAYQLEVVVYNSQPPYPSEGVADHESFDGVAAVIGRVIVTP